MKIEKIMEEVFEIEASGTPFPETIQVSKPLSEDLISEYRKLMSMGASSVDEEMRLKNCNLKDISELIGVQIVIAKEKLNPDEFKVFENIKTCSEQSREET